MKELVEVIAKALVDNPDEVVVTEKSEGKNVTVELHVAASDMGKVIGKQGRIAKAIRSVVKAASLNDNKRVDVDIRQFALIRVVFGQPFIFSVLLTKTENTGELYGRFITGWCYYLYTWSAWRS